MKKTLATIASTSLLLGGGSAISQAAEPSSSYVVSFKSGTDSVARKALASINGVAKDELDYVLDGFTVNLTATQASTLAKNSAISAVVRDLPVQLFDTQSPVPSWGLDRIDQQGYGLDNKFNYPTNGGSGVKVYVVDTGVQADLPNFQGRVTAGYDATGSGVANIDCNGHGTHVAGTVASSVYGVAKSATIVPVKVIGCSGMGQYSWVLSGLDWIAANHVKGTPAVVNLSIGGSKYPLLNSAISKLVANGLVVTVAAGNSGSDACDFSPSSATDAITVGATGKADVRSPFSNYGNCVDIFAPGSSIVSESASNPTAGTTKTGTSMSSPHVAGVAALYLATNPKASPAVVAEVLASNGIKNVVADSYTPSGNVLVNTAFLMGSVAPAPIVDVPTVPVVTPTPTPAPTPVASNPPNGQPSIMATKPLAFRATTTSVNKQTTLQWNPPANASKVQITGYVVEAKSATSTSWMKVAVAKSTSHTVSMLPIYGTISYRVSAITASGVGEASLTISLRVVK